MSRRPAANRIVRPIVANPARSRLLLCTINRRLVVHRSTQSVRQGLRGSRTRHGKFRTTCTSIQKVFTILAHNPWTFFDTQSHTCRSVPLHVLYAYGTDTSEDDMPPFPPLSTITGRLAVPKPAPYKPRGGRGASSSTRGKSTSSAPPSQPSQQAKASSSARLVHSAAAPSTSKRGRKPSNPGKTNADFRLKHMKKCFRAAGFQKLRFKELWQGE